MSRLYKNIYKYRYVHIYIYIYTQYVYSIHTCIVCTHTSIPIAVGISLKFPRTHAEEPLLQDLLQPRPGKRGTARGPDSGGSIGSSNVAGKSLENH